MNLIQKIKKAEKNLKTYHELVSQAQKRYIYLLNQDDGNHKNHWQEIEQARKSLDVLKKGKLTWVRKITLLEKEIKQSNFTSH